MKASLRTVLFLSFFLAACSPSPVGTETVSIPPESTVTPVSSEAPPEPETATASPAPSVRTVMEGCTLQTLLAPPNATEVSRFPAPGPDDWQIGPETAAVTIVEYGDFQ